jgi:5-methylcytosine-specific restriction enzyme A
VCGSRATDVDHVLPAWRGGSDEPTNLTSLCGPCHDEKSIRESIEAREHYRRLNRRADKMPWEA